MFFEKKVNRAMDWLKDKNENEQINEGYLEDAALFEEDIDLKAESTLKEEIGKGDILALLISAFLMFTPVILLVLGVFVLLAYWFF